MTLDLLREHSAPDCLAFLQARRAAAPTLPCEEVLTGTVHNRVGKMLLRTVPTSSHFSLEKGALRLYRSRLWTAA